MESQVTAEEVQVFKNINIASLVTDPLALLVWIFVLPGIIAKKLWGLLLIAVLMITC